MINHLDVCIGGIDILKENSIISDVDYQLVSLVTCNSRKRVGIRRVHELGLELVILEVCVLLWKCLL